MFSKKNSQADIVKEYTTREKTCGLAIGVIAIVFSLAIMHGDTTLIEPGMQRLVAIPNYLAMLVLMAEIVMNPQGFRLYLPLFIAWLFHWFLDGFHVAPGVDISIQASTLILIFLFCMMTSRVWHYGFRVYRLFLIFSSFFGIIAFISFITGIIQPLETVDYYNKSGGENALYIVYPFSYLFLGLQDGIEAVRLCGLFNEPGYFGTILALALVADGFNMRSIGNWMMLLAGCFTLSFAFFVLILLYWAIRAIRKIKVLFSIVAFSALFLFVVLPKIPEDSPAGWLAQRFAYNKEEKKLAGDDRTTSAFDMYWDQAVRDGSIVFGKGGGFFNNKDVGSLSCKKVIVEHGIVFSFLLWGMLFFACLHFKRNNVTWWALLICFFVSVYQRPSVFLFSYMIVLFGGIKNIDALLSNKKIKDSKIIQKKLIKEHENSYMCV